MPRLWFACGALFCFLGVAIGAFGAHGLRGKVSTEMLAIFETGVRYQMYHGLALFAVALASIHWPGTLNTIAGSLFIIGIIIFSGTLYGITITGMKWLGAVTPIGGLMFLVSWLLLLISVLRKTA